MAKSLIKANNQIYWKKGTSNPKLLEVILDNVESKAADTNLIVTKAYLDEKLGDVASPMTYRGTLTVVTTGDSNSTQLPSTAKQGDMYYISGSAGVENTYVGTAMSKLPCTDGDMIIAKGNMTAWTPANFDVIAGSSRDNVVIANTAIGANDNWSLVKYDKKGLVTAGTNPTTLIGYGITDATPSSHIGSTGTAHGVATGSVSGFMSGEDKAKLDGIPANATANLGTVTSISTTTAGVTIGGTSAIPTINIKSADGTNKGLSEDNFTSAEKTKLAGIAAGATANLGTVTSISTNTAGVTIGGTSAIPTINIKSADGTDKGLSENNFTSAEKTKLAGIEANANKYTHPAGYHIPSGGTDEQVLVNTGVNGTYEWKTISVAKVVPAIIKPSSNTFTTANLAGIDTSYPLMVFLNGQLLQAEPNLSSDDVAFSSNTYTISTDLYTSGDIVIVIYFKTI